MAYQSRIPADLTYIHSVGTAFYNFTYLEWVVVWMIVKLNADGFGSVPRGETARAIAKALHKAIENTSPPLPTPLRQQLIKFHESYLAAISSRNKLLHAHPYTTQEGEQQLGGGGVEWPISAVDQAARLFENAAIEGNAIFHGELAQVRP